MMKVVEDIPEASRTDLGQILINHEVNFGKKLMLTWAATAEELPRVKSLMQHFDCPLAFDFQELLVHFLIPQAALPVLIKQVQLTWPNDQQLIESLQSIQAAHRIIWQAGRFQFDLTTRGLVYGILNVTPDSFYDGGDYDSPATMQAQIDRMVSAGADVIEVGGQTTKPGGYHEISPDEEIQRIMPAINYLRDQYPQTAIAVDTYKLPVMQAALDAGVDIINDVHAFETKDKQQLMAKSKVGLITMHSNRDREYENLSAEMVQFFQQNVATLIAAGINRHRLCLDQGIGYAKDADGPQDLVMMNNLSQLNQFRLPLLIAISRKGFGKRLFGLNKKDRLPVTLIAEAAMYLQGGRVLRVHDVEETKQLVGLLDQLQSAYWFKPTGKQSESSK